jgi:hypothetical protein
MEFQLYKKKLLSHYPETKNHYKQKLIHIIKQKDCSCLPESEKGSSCLPAAGVLCCGLRLRVCLCRTVRAGR